MTVSRRESMAWMLAAAGMVATGLVGGAARPAMAQGAVSGAAGAPWPVIRLAPLTGPGYGTDPDTMNPRVTWPLTLAKRHRALINVLGDLILPADELSKGAGQCDIAAFFDEWISAPYPNQQSDRPQFLALLLWLDAQSRAVNGVDFVASGAAAQTSILDGLLGYRGVPVAAADVFTWFRVVMIYGYYALPDNLAVAGLEAEDPILGDYPGPSDAAMAHLNGLLASLNLPVYGKA